MREVILSPEQAAIVASAEEPITIRGPAGEFIGWVWSTSQFRTPSECPFTPEEVAAAELEADGPGPWYTTKQVLEHLRSLDQFQS